MRDFLHPYLWARFMPPNNGNLPPYEQPPMILSGPFQVPAAPRSFTYTYSLHPRWIPPFSGSLRSLRSLPAGTSRSVTGRRAANSNVTANLRCIQKLLRQLPSPCVPWNADTRRSFQQLYFAVRQQIIGKIRKIRKIQEMLSDSVDSRSSGLF